MSSSTPSSTCMLIFRGTDWHKGLSSEEMQQVAGQWRNWFDRLAREGKAIAGNPLENDGRTVSLKYGRVVADGPFAESKEAIGGYFLLKVSGLDEAVEIAKECPGIPHGAVVEVRTIAEECPIGVEGQVEIHHAAALA